LPEVASSFALTIEKRLLSFFDNVKGTSGFDCSTRREMDKLTALLILNTGAIARCLGVFDVVQGWVR